jgi:DNA-binding NarL/FixJ family response regulator
MSDSKRIFLVDDHPLVREWLGALIAQHDDLTVCGEAESAPEALSGILRDRPDIAIVDLSLAGGSGIELIKDIAATCPRVAVLVLSMHEEPTYAERALRAGAMGYVVKRESTKNIIQAIRDVLAGKIFLGEKFALAMARRLVRGPAGADAPQSPVETFSDRELQVFEMLGSGRDTRAVADELCLSMKTVQAYCARIKEKLQITTAHELLREAVLWCERKRDNSL